MRLVDGSSNVAATGHDGKSLFVRYRRKAGTALYHYPGVPGKLHEEMQKSESVGEFIHRNIRNFYPGVRIIEKEK